MDNFVLQIRGSLIQRLKLFINKSEDIYLGIVREFPPLLDLVRNGLKNAVESIKKFEESSSQFNETGNDKTLVGRAKNLVLASENDFTGFHRLNDEIMELLNAHAKQIINLDSCIQDIRRNSESIELIALNAMTVAIKAGKAGGAFSFITEELKRLAMVTIENSKALTELGLVIQKNFKNYIGLISETKDFESTIFSSFRQSLDSCFSSFNSGVARIIQMIRRMYDKAETIKTSFVTINEELQFQDIIRQSINHIILSLDAISLTDHELTEEEMLDYLQFLSNLTILCISVISDVKGQLVRGIANFNGSMEESTRIIMEVEKEKESSLELMDGSGAAEESCSFGNSETLVNDIIVKLETSIDNKRQLNLLGTGMLRDINNIIEGFEAFTATINKYKSVIISSKIEIAKQPVLKRMDDTVDELILLTRQIEDIVTASLGELMEFHKKTKRAFKDFGKIHEKEKRFVEVFRMKLSSVFQSLFGERNKLRSTLNDFSVFSDKFSGNFDRARKQLLRLGILARELSFMEDIVKNLNRKTVDKQRTILDALQLKSWEIRDGGLRGVIEKFTIQHHKSTAGKLEGFEVEEGIASSDVTYF